MRAIFTICLFLNLYCLIFSQETKKQKFSDPIYVNTIISVKQSEGKLKDLIFQISEQNKGIPAIIADQLALEANIPPIKAEFVRMGILMMALHKVYDEVSEIELNITTDQQAVIIKGKKIEKAKIKFTRPSKLELVVYKIKRSPFIKSSIEKKSFDIFIETIRLKLEISVLSFYDEAVENQIYLYGTNEDAKLLERLILRTEKRWLENNEKNIVDWVDEVYKEERLEQLQSRIKDSQTAVKVYKIHKDNAIEKINNGEGNHKEKLKEIEDLEKHIEESEKQIKLLTAEIEKLKK